MSLIFVAGSFFEESSGLTLGLLGVCLAKIFYIIISNLSSFFSKSFKSYFLKKLIG